VICLLILGYVLARQSSFFALRTLQVRGATPEVADAVRAAAQPFVGESLVALDGDELAARVRALPAVVSVAYDRAFPNTLRLHVRLERPAAVIRAGAQSWLVSGRGRVIEAIDRLERPDLPRVWLPSATELHLGDTLTTEEQGAAVRALARVPAEFPAPVVAARARDGSITLVLAQQRELRLGAASDIRLKLDVAQGMLSTLTLVELADLLYLDVSLPTRPVAGLKSLLSG
jgi:cell division protein FtsQ